MSALHGSRPKYAKATDAFSIELEVEEQARIRAQQRKLARAGKRIIGQHEQFSSKRLQTLRAGKNLEQHHLQLFPTLDLEEESQDVTPALPKKRAMLPLDIILQEFSKEKRIAEDAAAELDLVETGHLSDSEELVLEHEGNHDVKSQLERTSATTAGEDPELTPQNDGDRVAESPPPSTWRLPSPPTDEDFARDLDTIHFLETLLEILRGCRNVDRHRRLELKKGVSDEKFMKTHLAAAAAVDEAELDDILDDLTHLSVKDRRASLLARKRERMDGRQSYRTMMPPAEPHKQTLGKRSIITLQRTGEGELAGEDKLAENIEERTAHILRHGFFSTTDTTFDDIIEDLNGKLESELRSKDFARGPCLAKRQTSFCSTLIKAKEERRKHTSLRSHIDAMKEEANFEQERRLNKASLDERTSWYVTLKSVYYGRNPRNALDIKINNLIKDIEAFTNEDVLISINAARFYDYISSVETWKLCGRMMQEAMQFMRHHVLRLPYSEFTGWMHKNKKPVFIKEENANLIGLGPAFGARNMFPASRTDFSVFKI